MDSPLPPMSEDVKAILMGRPAIIRTPQITRFLKGKKGWVVPKDRASRLVYPMYWLLGHYAADPVNWRANAQADYEAWWTEEKLRVKQARLEKKTDGSQQR